MNKVLVLFVFVFVTVISIQAQTPIHTGITLVDLMRAYDKVAQGNPAADDYVYASTFVGYVTGVCDAMEISFPVQTKTTQIVAIVAKYLKEHPELWAKPAAHLVRQAIIEAFDLKP